MRRCWGSSRTPEAPSLSRLAMAVTVRVTAGLPADLPDRMRELGENEPTHRQAYRSRRAGHEENDGAAHHARVGARQHGGRADLLEGEHAEQLAEAIEAALEQRAHRLGRAVPGAEA